MNSRTPARPRTSRAIVNGAPVIRIGGIELSAIEVGQLARKLHRLTKKDEKRGAGQIVDHELCCLLSGQRRLTLRSVPSEGYLLRTHDHVTGAALIPEERIPRDEVACWRQTFWFLYYRDILPWLMERASIRGAYPLPPATGGDPRRHGPTPPAVPAFDEYPEEDPPMPPRGKWRRKDMPEHGSIEKRAHARSQRAAAEGSFTEPGPRVLSHSLSPIDVLRGYAVQYHRGDPVLFLQTWHFCADQGWRPGKGATICVGRASLPRFVHALRGGGGQVTAKVVALASDRGAIELQSAKGSTISLNAAQAVALAEAIEAVAAKGLGTFLAPESVEISTEAPPLLLAANGDFEPSRSSLTTPETYNSSIPIPIPASSLREEARCSSSNVKAGSSLTKRTTTTSPPLPTGKPVAFGRQLHLLTPNSVTTRKKKPSRVRGFVTHFYAETARRGLSSGTEILWGREMALVKGMLDRLALAATRSGKAKTPQDAAAMADARLRDILALAFKHRWFRTLSDPSLAALRNVYWELHKEIIASGGLLPQLRAELAQQFAGQGFANLPANVIYDWIAEHLGHEAAVKEVEQVHGAVEAERYRRRGAPKGVRP